MYIEPQTNIKILKNVPLDTTYEHTIYFNSLEAQRLYFASKQKYNLANYTYQRVQRGMARVGIKADDLYDCNYMMFQNTAYGNKWFYAYITAVEFVNNETAQITFELDVMQTWFFDCEPDYCFVEREHSVTDGIGENIVPESVALGEYVANSYDSLKDFTDLSVIIAIVDTSQPTDGKVYDGIYGSATLYAYDSTAILGINNKINEYLQKPDAIISMYVCPTQFVDSIGTDHKIATTTQAKVWGVLDSAISTNDTIDGYLPKNAKLYTYPYNFYHVDNASGSELSLRYEFFANLIPSFEISCMITQPVKACIRPSTYKNTSTQMGSGTLNTESITLSNFPMCSWNVDAYQAWVAQNSVPMTIDAVSSLVGMGVTAATAATPSQATSAGAGAIKEGISLVANVLKQHYIASIGADISKGSMNNGGINASDGHQQFYGGRFSITHQMAKIIDDFFTRFGYATNQLKVPNRNSRSHWNYVKTIGCTVTGSVPADDMRKICSIYDNGITFWKQGSEVGDYSQNNSLIR